MKEESKEPEIKLFGRKIVLPENGVDVSGGEDPSGKINDGDCDLCEEVSDGGIGEEGKAEYEKQPPDEGEQIAEQSEKQPPLGDENPKESKHPNSTTGPEPHPKTPPTDQGTISVNNPKPETEQTDPAKNGPQKALKKPDKILPCPRCNSMNTKFCYYNNYNVNQPRHFCRSCQRYWTAGGTMRNVPVGAGRRKSKSSASSHCSHITISETLHTASVEPPNSKSNTTILSFRPGPGLDSPLSESMASSLNLTSKQAQNGVRNGFQKNGEDTGGGPTGMENGPREHLIHNTNGLHIPVHCVSGIPWNFPVPLPVVCPMPFYPSPYWNYNLPNAWSYPWLVPQPCAANQNTTGGSKPEYPLGKHSRNGELIKAKGQENKDEMEAKKSERSIVVPKTLRIDDPNEAAKSSIWETLGIEYKAASREGLLKALQPRGGEGNMKVSVSTVLQANPAAFSRSISFQEAA